MLKRLLATLKPKSEYQVVSVEHSVTKTRNDITIEEENAQKDSLLITACLAGDLEKVKRYCSMGAEFGL